MTNFFPLLDRAVSRLAIASPQARQELYDHARTILVTQLQRRNPRPPVSEIIREQAALEMAIRRVEAESALAHPQPPKDLGGMNPTIIRRSRDEAVAPGMSSSARADHMRSRPENRFPTNTEAVNELKDRKKIRRIPDIANNLLPRETTDGNIESSVAERKFTITPVINRDVRTQHEHEKFPRRRALPKQKDPNLERAPLGPRIIGIVLSATMVVILLVACIALVPIYISRLIWLSEHLIDNPTLLVAIPITVGLFLLLVLLLALPIFRKRRRKSVNTFFSA
jgi:hypothetical protein